MEKIKRRNNVFGIISLVIISLMNLCFTIPFFTSMLIEQIKIGSGTNLEMGALVVWMVEMIATVPLIVCIVFTIISIIKKDYIPKIVINIVEIVLYIILHIVANLFIII